MLERLQKIFVDLTGRTDIVITPKTSVKDYNISSFAMVQLVCAIEDEFDVEIPNSQIRKFKTVKDVMKFLEKETEESADSTGRC